MVIRRRHFDVLIDFSNIYLLFRSLEEEDTLRIELFFVCHEGLDWATVIIIWKIVIIKTIIINLKGLIAKQCESYLSSATNKGKSITFDLVHSYQLPFTVVLMVLRPFICSLVNIQRIFIVSGYSKISHFQRPEVLPPSSSEVDHDIEEYLLLKYLRTLFVSDEVIPQSNEILTFTSDKLIYI